MSGKSGVRFAAGENSTKTFGYIDEETEPRSEKGGNPSVNEEPNSRQAARGLTRLDVVIVGGPTKTVAALAAGDDPVCKIGSVSRNAGQVQGEDRGKDEVSMVQMRRGSLKRQIRTCEGLTFDRRGVLISGIC